MTVSLPSPRSRTRHSPTASGRADRMLIRKLAAHQAAPEHKPASPATLAVYCPVCLRQLVRITANVGKSSFELRSCSYCDLRWWNDDMIPATFAQTLATMTASSAEERRRPK